MTNQIYKEFYETNSDEESSEKWRELRAKGYNPSEIYQFNYEGKDGKFHREIFVFSNKNERMK